MSVSLKLYFLLLLQWSADDCVGLFTPNAGQHFRDEQRRRRSQYDRGTRLAALEEYDYENSLGHQAGYLTQH